MCFKMKNKLNEDKNKNIFKPVEVCEIIDDKSLAKNENDSTIKDGNINNKVNTTCYNRILHFSSNII